MDQRGWNTEFRVMMLNIAVRKKLDRDLGKHYNTAGGHIRKNLSEIILMQNLLEKSGWMNAPNEPRNEFVNLDENKILSEDLVQFWSLCTNNRDVGVNHLLKDTRVAFKDVKALKEEEDDKPKEMKAMLRDLPSLVEQIPSNHPTKEFITEHFKNEIKSCRNIATVENFYSMIQQILLDIDAVTQDDTAESDDDINDDQIIMATLDD